VRKTPRRSPERATSGRMSSASSSSAVEDIRAVGYRGRVDLASNHLDVAPFGALRRFRPDMGRFLRMPEAETVAVDLTCAECGPFASTRRDVPGRLHRHRGGGDVLPGVRRPGVRVGRSERLKGRPSRHRLGAFDNL
jgi:hypothetical protein